MNAVIKLNQLTEGQEVVMVSHQFKNAKNKCRLICFDYSGLNRDIAYFQYTERGHKVATKEGIKSDIGQYTCSGVFALWGHELAQKTTSIYTINSKP